MKQGYELKKLNQCSGGYTCTIYIYNIYIYMIYICIYTYVGIHKHTLHIFIAPKTVSLFGSTNYLRNVDDRY